MDAVILSAGLGTRLGEVGKKIPKVLLPYGTQTLLSFHIKNLINLGFKRIFINTFHLHSKIEDYLNKNHFDIDIHIEKENSLSGTAGGVKKFEKYLNENFLVIYGDIVGYEIELNKFLKFSQSQQNIATLWAYQGDFLNEKGLIYGKGNLIYEFHEKRSKSMTNETLNKFINGGLYWLRSEIFSYIDSNSITDFGHDVFPKLLKNQQSISYFLSNNSIIDLGTIN